MTPEAIIFLLGILIGIVFAVSVVLIFLGRILIKAARLEHDEENGEA